MTIYIKNKHTLQIGEFKFKCCIGKRGLTINKKEVIKKLRKASIKLKIFTIEKIEF